MTKPEQLGGGKIVIDDHNSESLIGVAQHRTNLSVLIASVVAAENGRLGHVIKTAPQAGVQNEQFWLGIAGGSYDVGPKNPGPVWIPDEKTGSRVIWVESLEHID